MDEQIKVTTLRLPMPMYKELAKSAIDDNRSANQQIIFYIRKMLDERAKETA